MPPANSRRGGREEKDRRSQLEQKKKKTVIAAASWHADQVKLLEDMGALVKVIPDRVDAFFLAEIREAGAQPASREQALVEADVLTLHVPLLEKTRKMIAQRELGMMKPTAFLINTARGHL